MRLSSDTTSDTWQTVDSRAWFRIHWLRGVGLVCAGLLAAMLFAATAHAQSKPMDVKKGSPERKAILDALRPHVEKELKQKVEFVVDSMKTQKGFAFMQLRVQKPGGKPIDYSKTRYKEDIEMGAFDEGLFALVKKEKKGWRLLRYSLGATDVPYLDWPKEFKAPRELLGIPPGA